MAAKLAEQNQMTIEDFLAFAEQRPDGERWELIEGMAIMNAAPTQWHQRIALNIGSALDAIKLASGASWTANLGVGTRVPASTNSLPQPDLVVQEHELLGLPVTEDSLIIFEVLSKSNTKADSAWRKQVYSSVPNCQHYVTVATAKAEIVHYDRADGWVGASCTGLEETLALAAINAELPLRGIYRWTPID